MESGLISFRTEFVQAAVVLVVGASNLDHESVDTFGAHLDRMTLGNPGKVIVLDLSAVQTLSSVVIGRIFSARKKQLGTDGELKLVVPSPVVKQVMKVCQLDRIMGIFDSVEEALNPPPG